MRNWRLRTWSVAGAIVAGMMGSAACAADEPRVFSPSSDWTLESDTESCAIRRQFGGEDGISFRIQAFAPSGKYRITLWGHPLPQRDNGAIEFTYSLKPHPGAVPVTGTLGRSGGKPVIFYASYLATEAQFAAAERGESIGPIATRIAEVDGYEITFSRGRPLLLEIGSMIDPIGMLSKCADELPAKWGLDLAEQRAISRAAQPVDMQSWLGFGSYPHAFWRNRLSLLVYFRLMVDENGTATACNIQAPITESGAEQLTCREIMKAARFEPALDADGRPVSSYFATLAFYHMSRRNGNN